MTMHSSVAVFLTLFCAALFAQSDKSTIRGTVADASGAVVPRAELSVTELATSTLARKVTTDDSGNYEITDLKPGVYRLNAEAAGFKSFTAENLLLETAQVRRVDVTLQVGSTTESITVEAGAAAINTETGMLSGSISSMNVRNSPQVLPYPSVYAILTTVPGIQGAGWQVRISGQAPNQTSQGFDGVENDRYGGNTNNVNFYDEIQVATANNTAENSRVSSFNMTSKRGSNQYHAMAYYKHFNSGLNARNFFDPVKIPFIQHEWQAEASGPIWKDKTFFYASYFGQRMPLGTFKNATVPSLPMRRGDFSQFSLPNQVIQDPLTAAGANGNRTPFPNQIIPASRFSGVARRTQENYLPEPNRGDPNFYTANNFGFQHPFHYDFYRGDWPFARVDHNLTGKNTVYVRFLMGYYPYILDRNLPKFIWTRLRDHRQWAISDTHVFNPSLVNTLRAGIQTNLIRDGDSRRGVSPLQGDQAVKDIGLQGVNAGNYSAQGFPIMNITGVQSLSTIAGGIGANDRDWSIEESLTWNRGKHVWKFGGEVRRFGSFNGRIPDGTYGSFSFNGAMTRSTIGYADFLLGIPQSASRLDPLTNRLATNKEWGLFFTDSFKVSSRLTLDYGLRYDYYALPTFTDRLMYNWDRATNTVNVTPEGARKIHPLYPRNINVATGPVVPKPDKRNVRPRLSAAYRLRDTLVFRGGYGTFTERIDYFSRILTGGPFQISENYQNVVAPGGGALLQFPNPFPASLASAAIPSQSITGYPIQTDTGTIHQFNLSIEKEWRGIGLRTSYVGSRGAGLNYNIAINKPEASLTPFAQSRRPYPNFVGVSEARSNGRTKYDSLQIQATKKMGDFTFNAHWTLANSFANFLNLENPYRSLEGHWARQAGDRRHYGVVMTTYRLPLGRGRKFMSGMPAAADHILGGWTVSTISYLSSGFFFSPGFSGSDPSNTNTIGGLPDRIGNGNLPSSERSYTRWFDPSAFRTPQAGLFGNSAPNVLVGQGINAHHLGLAKRFAITEKLSTTFTAQVSDIFNTPHFNEPSGNISVPNTVGRFTSVVSDFGAEKHNGRRIALMLRVEF
jgi:hypothetical protein